MLTFIGTIKEPKGLHGEISLVDVPEGLRKIIKGTKAMIGYSEKFSHPFTIEHLKTANGKYLLKLKEISSPEKARSLKEQGIFINNASLEFSEETYKVDDLIGCSVFNCDSKERIGVLKEVLVLPANDVWLIALPDGELPIPVIIDVIKKVNITKKRIDIHLIDGLLDLKTFNEKRKETYRIDEN